MFKTLGFVLVVLVVGPLFLVLWLVFMGIWIVTTLTGIGPLLQYCYNQRDAVTLHLETILNQHTDLRMITVPAGINSASGGNPYRLCLRFTKPTNNTNDNNKPPIVIPNGLGATLALGARMHDDLVERGYHVLSYDRLGVGFSDKNMTGKSPSGADVCREMDFVIRSVDTLPTSTKWLAIGPSMGSIVVQAYLAMYPERYCGFLNLDVLPSPLIRGNRRDRSLFDCAHSIHC